MKKYVLKTIIALIFILLLDGCFFLFRDTEQCVASVWSALIGLNVGYLALFLIPLCAPKEKGVKVLSDTLYLIGTFYFVAELIVGMTFLFWELDTPTLPIVLQVVLLGIYIIVLLSSVMANDSTQEALKQQSNESDNIRSMLAEAEDVCLMVKKDPSVYKVVMRCYDDIKASPLRSTPEVQDIENEITSSLVLMRGYASSGDMSAVVTTASQVRQLVARRNSRLKNIRNY